MSQFFVTVIKIPNENNLEEEKVMWVHGFRGAVHGQQIPSLGAQGEAEHRGARVLAEESCLAQGSQEAEKGGGQDPQGR